MWIRTPILWKKSSEEGHSLDIKAEINKHFGTITKIDILRTDNLDIDLGIYNWSIIKKELQSQ